MMKDNIEWVSQYSTEKSDGSKMRMEADDDGSDDAIDGRWSCHIYREGTSVQNCGCTIYQILTA